MLAEEPPSDELADEPLELLEEVPDAVDLACSVAEAGAAPLPPAAIWGTGAASKATTILNEAMKLRVRHSLPPPPPPEPLLEPEELLLPAPSF